MVAKLRASTILIQDGREPPIREMYRRRAPCCPVPMRIHSSLIFSSVPWNCNSLISFVFFLTSLPCLGLACLAVLAACQAETALSEAEGASQVAAWESKSLREELQALRERSEELSSALEAARAREAAAAATAQDGVSTFCFLCAPFFELFFVVCCRCLVLCGCSAQPSGSVPGGMFLQQPPRDVNFLWACVGVRQTRLEVGRLSRRPKWIACFGYAFKSSYEAKKRADVGVDANVTGCCPLLKHIDRKPSMFEISSTTLLVPFFVPCTGI